MCTAISFHSRDHYFGRNLDLSYSYHESVTVTPRHYPLHFRKLDTLDTHLAMIGMAYVMKELPLYYEATNEKGLSMAGLNFPKSAVYREETAGMDNAASFELIPWILAQCATVAQARPLLARLNVLNLSFSNELPLSPLHWILADAQETVILEPHAEGLRIYDNPVGVLTNEPPFPTHLDNLRSYLHLTPNEPENTFAPGLDLVPASFGLGAIGLPGDPSSPSRFVRAAFTLHNSRCGEGESESVSQFFHILNSVRVPRGIVRLSNDKNHLTIYSCCCNTSKGVYYYTTHDNSQITAVDMHRTDLDGSEVTAYPMLTETQIHWQN